MVEWKISQSDQIYSLQDFQESYRITIQACSYIKSRWPSCPNSTTKSFVAGKRRFRLLSVLQYRYSKYRIINMIENRTIFNFLFTYIKYRMILVFFDVGKNHIKTTLPLWNTLAEVILQFLGHLWPCSWTIFVNLKLVNMICRKPLKIYWS